MILLLEDSHVQVELITQTVEKHFPDVGLLVARSLAEFIEIYLVNEVDMVISDIMLPDIEPEALIHALKLIDTPVVFYSGSGYHDLCEKHGQVFIRKGEGVEKLCDEIGQHLKSLQG